MIDFLEKHRLLLLIFVGAATIFFLVGVSQLRINFSFDRFYPKDSSDYFAYQDYQARFGQDQNLTLYIALGPEKGDIFQYAFLRKADSVFASVAALPGIDTAIYLTRIRQAQRTGLGFADRPVFRLDQPASVPAAKKRFLSDSTLAELFSTRSARYAVGYFRIEKEIFDTQERDILSRKVASTLETSGLSYVISGLPYIRSKYVEKIGGELILFVAFSFLLILAVLVGIYRSAWGVFVPIATVLIGMIWVAGLMGWTGQDIDLLNNMLIPIMFVVGISDVIHLVTKYVQERKNGISAREAVRTTLREIGLATFLTSLTTAIGFASLGISRIPPIRILGFIAAAGVLMAWAIAVIIIPFWLQTGSDRHHINSHGQNSKWLGRLIDRLEKWVHVHPRSILAGFGLATGISVYLALGIPRDTFLLEDVGKNDPIRASMEFFERESYGMRPFEASLAVKPGRRLSDLEALRLIDGIEKELYRTDLFSPLISPASLIREANHVAAFRREGSRSIPSDQAGIDELITGIAVSRPEALSQVMNDSFTVGRISGRMPDIGAQAFDTLRQRVIHYLETNDPEGLLSVHFTGNAVLTENNLEYIRANLLQGLGLALVAVGLLMGLLFQSLRMVVISLIPNLIPLILTAGVMGLFHLPLTASSAIVFVVAFGIALDDTIHLLTRYRAERKRGMGLEAAIRLATRQTGEAMVLTSLVLIGGFSLLTLSDFGATFNVGLLTSLTIIFAVASDLLLLPVLLRYLHK